MYYKGLKEEQEQHNQVEPITEEAGIVHEQANEVAIFTVKQVHAEVTQSTKPTRQTEKSYLE